MSTPVPSFPCIQPYIFFDGRTEEALEFYKKTIGAKVDAVMKYGESPDTNACGGMDKNKVMHSSFRVGGSVLFASDGRCGGEPKFEGFGLSLSYSSIPEAEQAFAALGEGGKVELPMNPTFYAKTFGMVIDRFGVFWMIIVPMECQ